MEKKYSLISPYLCRDCLTFSNEDFTLIVDEKIYNSLRNDTEFEAIKRITDWGAFDGLKCSTCSSNNLMVYYFKKDGLFLYDDHNLKSCIGSKKGVYILISKKGNQVSSKIVFSKNLSLQTHKGEWMAGRLIMQLVNVLKFHPASFFESSLIGKSEIMVFGAEDSNGIETQINRFYSFGLTKNEILNAIQVLLKKRNIWIEEISIIKPTEIDFRQNPEKLLESVHFRGALLNQFYKVEFETGIEEIKKGDSFICFKVDDKFLGLKIPPNIEPVDFYHSQKWNIYFAPPGKKPFFVGDYFYLLEEYDDMPK